MYRLLNPSETYLAFVPIPSFTSVPLICSPGITVSLVESLSGGLPAGFSGSLMSNITFASSDLSLYGTVYQMNWKAVDSFGTLVGTSPFTLTILPPYASINITSALASTYDIG